LGTKRKSEKEKRGEKKGEKERREKVER